MEYVELFGKRAYEIFSKILGRQQYVCFTISESLLVIAYPVYDVNPLEIFSV